MKRIIFLFRTVIFTITILFFISELRGQCLDEADTLCDIVPPFTPIYTESTIGGSWRMIISNGIPNHNIGEFGTPRVRPLACGRRNAISEQSYFVIIPINSGITETGAKEYDPLEPLTPFGVAINGVLFDPEAAEWTTCTPPPDSRWQKSALNHPDMQYDVDCNNGHVQGTGAYHYHGFPFGLFKKKGGIVLDIISIAGRETKTILLGWGFDGVPIYGPFCYTKTLKPREKGWWTPKSGWVVKTKPLIPPPYCVPPDAYLGYYDEDYEYVGGVDALDECNGHFAPTPEYPKGIYHYHITMNYPHIPRCYTEMK